jgi:flagellar protein FlaI
MDDDSLIKDEKRKAQERFGGLLGELLEKREEEYFYLESLEKVGELEDEKDVKILKVGEKYKVIRREGEKMPIYLITLPTLTKRDKKIMKTIEKRAIAEIAIDPESILDTSRRKRIFLREVSSLIARYYPDIAPEKRRSFAELIVQDMIGYGLLEPMLEDDNLEEIMVVGINKRVYVYHRKYGMCKTNIVFEADEEITSIITKIARTIGRRIDVSVPLLDARLPDGSRVNATLRPVSLEGPSLTIRKFKTNPYTIVDLIDFGTLSPRIAAFLWLIIEGYDVKPINLLISGGTSSGKTTTLNILGSFIPSTDRVVTIEDTAELQLPVEHWVRLETRPPNIEGRGEVTMDILLKNALRMRPDRIIVGEVRGSEANTLVASMNTGQDGSLGTLHANTAGETITRLTNPPMEVPAVTIPSLNMILMQNKFIYEGRMVRRITEIAEIRGMKNGEVELKVIYAWDPKHDEIMPTGEAILITKKLAEVKGVGLKDVEEELERRQKVIEYLVEKDLRKSNDVGRIINEYYVSPDKLLKKIAGDGEAHAKASKEVLEANSRRKIVKRDDERNPSYIIPLPELTRRDTELLEEVEATAISEIDVDPTSIKDRSKAEELFTRRVLKVIKEKFPEIPPAKRKVFSRLIVPNMLGYGLLEFLLSDDDLEEIMVVGTGKPVYVYHMKYGACRTNIVFKEDDEILRIIEKIARTVGRRIDKSIPLLDARLEDGSRVNATIPPISLNGPTITIRKFKKDPLTVVNLINFRTLTPEVAAYLWLVVGGMGVKPGNILAAGGSSSGKTTTLNCLASFIPSTQRVITIEDTAELQLPIEHVIKLETRLANVEGEGEITMDDLVKNTLRMRPDRIIVGEVRGSEARTLFTAMNTGHDGCMGTLHANSAKETITRLTNAPMNVPHVMLPALDVILMQDRVRQDGKVLRRIMEIVEVENLGRGRIRLKRIYKWNPKKDLLERTGVESVILREIERLKGLDHGEIKAEIKRRAEVLNWMNKNGITDLRGVARVIEEYYTNPMGLMEKVRAENG